MACMGMDMGHRRGREEELGGWVHRDIELCVNWRPGGLHSSEGCVYLARR